MDFVSGQTAVIAPVPGVEHVVADWRERYDPSAILGVPAHVTIVFPFVPLDHLDVHDLTDLRSIAARQTKFTAAFTRCARFPEVLYLAPHDDTPFRDLTAEVVRRWPDAPPYGGRFGSDEVVPHLTVTDRAGEANSARAEAAVSAQLPITAEVDALWLMAFDGARWRRQATLPLG